MARRSKKEPEPRVDPMVVAEKLNGSTKGLFPMGGGAVGVNGTKQVAVDWAENLNFRLGRLPAHASEELRQLAAKGLSGLGAIEEIKVPVGGRDRAGWRAGQLAIYHDPVVQS